MTDRMTAAELIALQKGRAKRGRVDREGPVHKAILELLAMTLPGDAVFHHSPNELDMAGPEAARQVAKHRKLGTKAGWPDFEIIWRGGFYAIEVKAEDGGRQSQAQRDRQADIIRAGGKYQIATSVEDAHSALVFWGLI